MKTKVAETTFKRVHTRHIKIVSTDEIHEFNGEGKRAPSVALRVRESNSDVMIRDKAVPPDRIGGYSQ